MTNPPPIVGTEMSEAETRSLLAGTSHGVLSMGLGNRGYGLPVAYQFEETADHVVLGFLNVSGSKKAQFASGSEEVTLTVYDFEDVDSWESGIVTGTIHPLEADTVTEEVSEEFLTLFFMEEENPSAKLRTYSFEQYDRAWYELRIADISGRCSGPGTTE